MASVLVEFRTWHLPHTGQKLYDWSSFIDGTHAPSDLRPVMKTVGGGTVKVTGARGAGRGPEYVTRFRLSLQQHHSSTAQINLWWPRPSRSHSVMESQSFRIIGKIFSRRVLAWLLCQSNDKTSQSQVFYTKRSELQQSVRYPPDSNRQQN